MEEGVRTIFERGKKEDEKRTRWKKEKRGKEGGMEEGDREE